MSKWCMAKDERSSAGQWLYVIGDGVEIIAHGVTRAHADRIVRACNAHDKLVAALERIESESDSSLARNIAREALAKVKS